MRRWLALKSVFAQCALRWRPRLAKRVVRIFGYGASPAFERSRQQIMIWQLLFALTLGSLTVALHAIGTVYVVIPAGGVWNWQAEAPKEGRPVWTLIRLVSLLLVLHLLEVAVWAVAFSIVRVFADFETSLYYSLKSYTTVGYGDVLPDNSWRLLGPIEAAIGVLMLGWSTSIIVAAVQRIYNSRSNSSSTRP
jgi:hypothetical protein